MGRTFALIEREMRRFRRSPVLIFMSMTMPIVQLVVLGYAFGGNVKHLKLAIVDQDHGVPAVRLQEMTSAVSSGAHTLDTVVYADRQRLRQALLNLAGNAVKYNRPGGDITIRTAPTTSGRQQITVADTGPGIDPADLHRIFDPFQRLDAAQSTQPGTGLGLTLTQRLVRAMGGTITVTSQPGHGTTFTIELGTPLAAPVPEPTPSRQ